MSTSDDYPGHDVPPSSAADADAYGSSHPESAPSQPAATGSGPPADALAGFWIRFAGALIDAILLSVVTGVIQAIVDGGAVLGIAIGGAYFTYLHASAAGQTVGNRVCGIRIVDVSTGGSIDYVRALLRWLMSYVSGIAILLGYLWMLWDPHNQTWHDKVANSYVVKTSHYPPPAPFGKPAT